MSTPAAKRRRIDSEATLSKPFKSPWKAPLKSNGHHEESNDKNATLRDDIHITVPTTTTPYRRTSNSHSKSSPSNSTFRSDPDILALQRQHTELLSHLNTLRADLDTHTQALKIETSGKDTKLERLIGVWKSASRLAAEDLFGGVRDRVNRMGGVGAWREKERNKNKGFGGGWDEVEKTDDGSGQDEEEGTEQQREMLREEMEGKVDVDVREEGVRKEVVEEGNDNDGFTMDMMLRSLNIELNIIGYDKEMQRWIE